MKKIPYGRAFCSTVQPNLDHHLSANKYRFGQSVGDFLNEREAKRLQFRPKPVMERQGAAFLFKQQTSVVTYERPENFFDRTRQAVFSRLSENRASSVAALKTVNTGDGKP